ncbi:5-oxoprolinase subunit B/C family protein [Diaphorobacter aerolatus]|uniref:5-oxoprolinase/urea amidolyase family protein n=1 Tax=Diaphorobacter aerolatus TaxID=1288495 RepID=A0A7H0GQB1_9BURK|nr:5-oxoprolinase/urea amidolyase family protein [Diaphorobacter aerolatus]QNP50477.1 5-oxoprolinase/urea amidolyase family protein [Diaphorobacter aerolatus]
MRFLPVNSRALLVELADLDDTLALLASLQKTPVHGVEELVPAAQTILVQFRPSATTAPQIVREIASRRLDARAGRSDVLVEIPVHYNGEDLTDVAQMLGISADEVIRRHTQGEYTVAFTGFAPGFGYLVGGDPIFNVPRRSSPRTRVPAGSVALAGHFSAVYPQASPGGWQLIGVTETPMWDLSRELPALLQPGYRVKFVDAATLPQAAATAAEAPAPETKQQDPSRTSALLVRATGLLSVFQDRGRHGQAGQGVSAAGAVDQAALKTANRLVGNASDVAALETVGGGLQLKSRGDTVVAVTGADAVLSITTAAGQRWNAARYAPFALADGDTLAIGQPVAGARCYVAVRGGFDVTPVLGSCSTDTLAHVGPEALKVGDVLSVLPAPRHAIVGEAALAPDDLPTLHDDVVLDIEFGPRTDWFTPDAVELLCTQRWQVTPQSNRVGLRILGDVPLSRTVTAELPSEGTPLGALQVPANGQPVLFLADHPLTGGYPVIACIAPHHLDRAGQIPVGAWLRFNPIRQFSEIAPAESASLSDEEETP